MKKEYALVFLMLFGLPACKKSQKIKNAPVLKNSSTYLKNSEVEVDIPLATEELAFNEDKNVLSFFDSEDEMDALQDDQDKELLGMIDAIDNQEFAWVDAENVASDFKTIYFDFDRYVIREDQKATVKANVEAAKELLAQKQAEGKNVKILAEGHASPETGSEAYNILLSEKRAATAASVLADLGVARENIQVVGRGQAVPAIINGKPVTGSREEQWPNRRVEFRVIEC